jgi:hypothetical protein
MRSFGSRGLFGRHERRLLAGGFYFLDERLDLIRAVEEAELGMEM